MKHSKLFNINHLRGKKSRIRVGLVRGKYLNNFEGQNYIFREKENIDLVGISSFNPLDQEFPFPVIRLWSLADLGGARVNSFISKTVRFLANRILGGDQVLFGLSRLSSWFDLFHTADPHYYYSYQLARLRRKNRIKKLIVTSWETIPFNNETVKKKQYIKRFTLKTADLFICYTNKAKAVLVREGVDESKIKIVRLGVDLDVFKPLDFKAKGEKKRFTILFVGRIVEEKGVIDLYRVFKGLRFYFKTKGSQLVLKIVGKGNLERRLRQEIKKDSLDKWVVIENYPYQDMAKVYQEGDVFVFPSKKTKTWEEQYGMALVEAMASGMAIVAYRTGAISEVLGQGGILIPEGDVDRLTYWIRDLVNNRRLREDWGMRARKRAVRFFDSKKTALNISRIYKTCFQP